MNFFSISLQCVRHTVTMEYFSLVAFHIHCPDNTRISINLKDVTLTLIMFRCVNNVSSGSIFSTSFHVFHQVLHIFMCCLHFCCLGFNSISLSISVPHTTCLPSLSLFLSDCTHFLVSPSSLVAPTPPSSTTIWVLIAMVIISSAAPPGQVGPSVLPLWPRSIPGKGCCHSHRTLLLCPYISGAFFYLNTNCFTDKTIARHNKYGDNVDFWVTFIRSTIAGFYL